MLDIDWSKVPEGYDWAEQDEDGCIYAYENRPFLLVDEGAWHCDGLLFFVGISKLREDWRSSLTRRPGTETQPSDVGAHEPEANTAEEPQWEVRQEDPSEMAERYRDARIRESFAIIMAELPALLEDREKLRKLTGVLG